MVRSITKVLRELDTDAVRQRSGRPFDKVVLHKILKNRTYIGLTVHKKEAYPGKHDAIIAEELWNEAQAIFREPPRARARVAAARDVALLRGLIFGPDGWAMTPRHARKEGRCYRYYVSTVTLKRGEHDGLDHPGPGRQLRRRLRADLLQALRRPEDDRGAGRQPAGARSQQGDRPHAHQGAVARLSLAEAARRRRLRQHHGDGGQGAHQPVLSLAHDPALASGTGHRRGHPERHPAGNAAACRPRSAVPDRLGAAAPSLRLQRQAFSVAATFRDRLFSRGRSPSQRHGPAWP